MRVGGVGVGRWLASVESTEWFDSPGGGHAAILPSPCGGGRRVASAEFGGQTQRFPLHTMSAQRDIRLPVIRLAAWSAGAGWAASCLAGVAVGLGTGVGATEALKAGLLAAAVTTLGVAAGVAVLVRLGPTGSRAGFAVLAGSMVRGAVIVVAGMAAQYTLGPSALALWVGLSAGWIAAKAAELRVALPAMTLKTPVSDAGKSGCEFGGDGPCVIEA